MSRRLSVIVLLVATTLLPAAGRATGRTKPTKRDEQAVRAVLNALSDAGLKRDVAAIDRIYAADFFHTNADGSIMTKAQVLASYRAPAQAVFESNEHAEERVQVYGDAAVVSGTVTLKGRMNEQPFVRSWRVTYVLSRHAGRWQIIASHASLIT